MPVNLEKVLGVALGQSVGKTGNRCRGLHLVVSALITVLVFTNLAHNTVQYWPTYGPLESTRDENLMQYLTPDLPAGFE